MFKKIATALVTIGCLAIATPAVFACPHEDKDKTAEAAPKTAEKTDKAKKQPVKKGEKKPAKKTTEKKTGDKVSMK